MNKKWLALWLGLAFLASCKKESSESIEDITLLRAGMGTDAGIYDASGRSILLRGVNYNVFGDYWRGVSSAPSTTPYRREDFRQMSSYGFNVVRLIFSWSAVEPRRGEIDYAYLSSLKQAIKDAGDFGLYVVLDMHQDAWGKYIASPLDGSCADPARGWDGAPDWATISDGLSTCTQGGRESAPAVIRAFDHFWDNTDGIQDRCIASWAEVVKVLGAEPNLAGYDLLNEPNMGDGTVAEEKAKLAQYYGKLIRAIRDAEAASGHPSHIVFFENAVTVNGGPNPIIPDPGFSTDQNMVFAPHHYFESISNQLSIEGGYSFIQVGASLYGSSMWVGEWGYFGGASDTSKIRRFAAAEDAAFYGSAWWQWCQAPGDPHGVWWDGSAFQAHDYSLHLIELNRNALPTGLVNDPFLQVLSRSRPLAVQGKVEQFTSDPYTGRMQLTATAQSEGITSLWIPGRYGRPNVNGDGIISTSLQEVEGGYRANVRVNGTYRVSVSF
jgi:endoglycosylceramidase